jgi:uncharacterized protein DUF6438
MTTALALAMLTLGGSAARAQEPAAVTLARTACFGTCPVYTVSIANDGAVRYEGLEHVRVTGTHTWRIDPAALRALADEMEKAGFFEMKSEYTARVTDMPTVTTTLTRGSRTKTVKDYFGAPPALKEIEARIDAVSGAHGYVRIDAAAIREMQAAGWRPAGTDAARWLDQALSAGDAGTVKALLAAGMNARAADADGVTLVMKAAESGDPDTVRAVLAAGGDPTARDRSGRNAADRARDGIKDPANAPSFVGATGRPRDYALVLKLLTDE